MEDPWNLANVISLGLFGLTAIGVLFTAGQALSARRARDAAEAANAEAREHERAALEAQRRAALAAEESAAASTRSADSAEDSAAASLRSAAALERRNELEERALTPADEPWTVERHDGPVWAVTNRTGFTLTFAALNTPLGYAETRIAPRDEFAEDLAPDGRMIFDVIDPAARSVTLQVIWANPVTMEQERWTREVNLLE